MAEMIAIVGESGLLRNFNILNLPLTKYLYIIVLLIKMIQL